MFFDIYKMLCSSRGISPKRAAMEIGLSNSVTVKWKAGATPSGSTLTKIAEHFGVTTDYLLGADLQSQIDLTVHRISELEKELECANECDRAEIEDSIQLLKESYEDLCLAQRLTGRNPKETAPTAKGERQISDDDIKFALFGGDGEITDAMFDEVKRFARMVKLREEAERKKE